MTYIEWQRKFVNGEQLTEYNEVTKELVHIDRNYYWERHEVYNLIGPFIRELERKKTKGIWGKKGIVEELIPYQKKYNELENKLMSMLSRYCSPILLVEDGSIDTDELCEEGLAPGKIVVYRQGSHAPELLRSVEEGDISLIYSLTDDARNILVTKMEDIKERLFFKNHEVKD